MRRDDRHGYARSVRLDPLDEVEPVAVRQPHVGQHQIETLAAEVLDGGGEVSGCGHLELHASERDREQFADVGLVVDYQGA